MQVVVPASILLFVLLIASRFMGERAMRQLSSDEKLRLIDGFTGFRTYAFMPVGVIALVLLGLLWWMPHQAAWIVAAGMFAMFCYLAGLQVAVAGRLKRLGFSPDFRRRVLLARSLGLAGLFTFAGAMVYFLVNRVE